MTLMSDCILRTRAPCKQGTAPIGQAEALHCAAYFDLIGHDPRRAFQHVSA